MNKQTTDDARFLELLERWLSGAFNRADERELHVLTETDAFRREAWEGFSALPETEHAVHLADIRRRLYAKRPARRVPLGAWLSAAAALVLVAAAIYFWPKTDPKDPTPAAQTAENTTPDTSGDIAAAPNPSEARSVSPSEGPAAPAQRSERSAKAAPPPEQDDLAAADMVKDEEKLADEAPAATREIGASAPGRMQQAQPTQAQDVASGVPAVNTAADKSPAAESAKPAAPATPFPMKKKADSVFPSDLPKAVATSPAAGPSGGWDAFREFLRRNARLPEAARNNNVSGSVRLQFSVGPDGKPANVQVLQKLGYGCDEEAERLVRLYDWAPPGAAPVVVEVPFRR